MFKKFKDKLAEEMKQSPARLQASVQQLAQVSFSTFPFTFPYCIYDFTIDGKKYKKNKKRTRTICNPFFSHLGSGIAGLVQQLDSRGAGVQ